MAVCDRGEVMREALIGFILACGFLCVVYAILHPVENTDYANTVTSAALVPVVVAIIWFMMEAIFFV